MEPDRSHPSWLNLVLAGSSSPFKDCENLVSTISWGISISRRRPCAFTLRPRDLDRGTKAHPGVLGPRPYAARQVERARIVLLAAAGRQNRQVVTEPVITEEKATYWREWFLSHSLVGLAKGAPRTGRTPVIARDP